MKRINFTLLLCIVILFVSCGYLDKAFRPSHFSMKYNGDKSGIEKIIRIDGYYANDTTLSVIFYEDGISCILLNRYAPAKIRGEIYLEEPVFQDKLIWGLYQIKHDTIYAQYFDKPLLSEKKILHYSYKMHENNKLHILKSCIYDNWSYGGFLDLGRPIAKQEDGGILSFYQYDNYYELLKKNWILSHKWAWKNHKKSKLYK